MEYNRVLSLLSRLSDMPLDFPLYQNDNLFFPQFVEKLLDDYVDIFKNEFFSEIDDISKAKRMLTRIEGLKQTIVDVLKYYYNGNLLRATQVFHVGISEIFSTKIPNSTQKLSINKRLYRARVCNYKAYLSREDIFHIGFENRHLVSTSRFSIPGLPALYLSDSTYTCWEEFRRYKIKKLWFSKFKNIRQLNVIKLERKSDFIRSIHPNYRYDNKIVENAEDLIYDYLVVFPISLICSIKVKVDDASFKPEYIIPQLLLQFVSSKRGIDGIKFPSTKVDYTRLRNIESYNYIFPVKKSLNAGFCSVLKDSFELTIPTNLEREEVASHTFAGETHSKIFGDHRSITLFDEHSTGYGETAFGKIEYILSRKRLAKIGSIEKRLSEFDL
ncbi:RES domain-containing protein [Flavobacterium sp.]|uniref:RES domain-containing protein n=1 Tax=Flavobacterium sp. TaxID=239 RepID=UPI0026185E9C|nr:RES domain-containing protein [Flavobacterium sp.]